ncbi:MAG TPA: AsmA family protein [Acidobacteriaceae bacterium]|jgi:hypothetical protein|nr:AsmA family protein [Acidobacteriaceae bacterium]
MSRMEELLSSEESGKRAGTAWRKLAIVGALVILLVLALVLPPLVNLNKYRRSITASMSEALGRPVYVGDMQLRLLPMPGIVMSDFTVEEDPAFGFEPALHANSVAASLRLSSLWRGRLEVSRISLDEVNLNLVRNAAGQWSIGSVLLRAAQIPNAPTGERHAGARPRFPYIEASDARIDFREGIEKKPFSLMNAEFSMWQASDDEWQLRLEAQPVRTDLELHLSDAGTVHVDGSLRRADNLLAMPVDLRAEWSGAQLGQVSRLLAGVDSGWRGDLHATTTIQGTGGDLRLETRLEIANLRRQEFQPPNTLNVDATCRSEYHHVERLLNNVTCFWPVGNGHLLLTGEVNQAAPADTHLELEINQVPASFPVRMMGLVRANAGNVTATGTLNGKFDWGPPGAAPAATTEPGSLTGDATASGVSLSFPGGSLTLPAMHFVSERPVPLKTKGKKPPPPAPTGEAVLLEPLPVALGEPKPLLADARLTQAGFELHLAGDASLGRLMTAGGNFGLLQNAFSTAASRGRATVNTTTTGSWMPPLAGATSGIATSGTLTVQNVELRPKFLRAPLQVESAEVDLMPDAITWKNAAFRYAGLTLQGELTFPVTCTAANGCPAHFTAAAGTLNAATLSTMVRGSERGFLGQLFSLGQGSPGPWPAAQGTVSCDALDLGRLAIDHSTATVTIDGGKLTIDALTGKALGGTLDASGTMTVADGVPQWKVDARLTGAKMNEAGTLFHEAWGGGTANGEASLTMHGVSAADLASSASGDFAFTWLSGGLAASRGGQEPLAHFDRWTAKGTVAKSVLTLTSGEVSRGAAATAVEGTIGFDRSLHLTVDRRAGRMRVAGMLGRPAAR